MNITPTMISQRAEEVLELTRSIQAPHQKRYNLWQLSALSLACLSLCYSGVVQAQLSDDPLNDPSLNKIVYDDAQAATGDLLNGSGDLFPKDESDNLIIENNVVHIHYDSTPTGVHHPNAAYGGYVDVQNGDASVQNTHVVMEHGEANLLFGAFAQAQNGDAKATGSTIIQSGGHVNFGYGAWASGETGASAIGRVIFTDATAVMLVGASAESFAGEVDATGSVEMTGGFNSNEVFGAKASSVKGGANATGNVNITNGNVSGGSTMVGAMATSEDSAANATGHVNIANGNVSVMGIGGSES